MTRSGSFYGALGSKPGQLVECLLNRRTKGSGVYLRSPCFDWLRGSDLNRRPLGYEGNPASERTQDSTSNPIENRATGLLLFWPACSPSAGVPAQSPHTR